MLIFSIFWLLYPRYFAIHYVKEQVKLSSAYCAKPSSSVKREIERNEIKITVTAELFSSFRVLTFES